MNILKRMDKGETMYNLINNGKENWEIQVNNKTIYEGNFVKVIAVCLSKLNFNTTELEEAVSSMVHNDHNAAHFGFGKTMIYTYNINESTKEAS